MSHNTIRAELQKYLWKLDTYQGIYWPVNKVCKSTQRSYNSSYHPATNRNPPELLRIATDAGVSQFSTGFNSPPGAFPNPDTVAQLTSVQENLKLPQNTEILFLVFKEYEACPKSVCSSYRRKMR